MKEKELETLKEMVNLVVYAPTKNDAQIPIRNLENMASNFKDDLDGYLSGKLNQVISYAIEASGRVKDKEHWIFQVEQSWYVFEGGAKSS
jgi:hypothetical protein